MNQLNVFSHREFGSLEILTINGKEYFPAIDIARKLDYKNANDAIIRHCRKDGVAFHEVIDSLNRKQNKKFITEGNLYRLISNSQMPQAEKFESWVFDEVLPSIRKHGAYMTPEKIEEALLNPDTIIKLATDLKSEREKRTQLEEQQRLDAPYTTFGKVVSNSSASINVGAFAKMMYDEYGLRIGRNKMFRWLRDNGYLIKSGREKNNPKQQYIEQGMFETTVAIVSRTHGDVESLTTLVTGKGQVRLSEKLLKEFEVYA